MSLRCLLALALVVLLNDSAPYCLAEETPPSNKPADASVAKPTGEKPAVAAEKFIRVRRDEKGDPLVMETAVVSFVSADGAQPGLQVDLVGAVHVGDKKYYDDLNKLFESYDVLLYELVAPEGTRVTKEGRKGGSAHPLGALQNGLKSLLELEHQLDCIDYGKANFVHADMSPEEFNKTMSERGESWFKMFLQMMGQGMAQQAKNGPEGSADVAILMALFSRDRPLKMKIAMADQFENLEGQLDAFNGANGSTIITERNRKAFEVLAKQIKAGKKKIGVFYGAGHLPDMQKRLQKDFALKRVGENWLAAWTLSKPAAPVAAPKP